jgi:hypothetical protein
MKNSFQGSQYHCSFTYDFRERWRLSVGSPVRVRGREWVRAPLGGAGDIKTLPGANVIELLKGAIEKWQTARLRRHGPYLWTDWCDKTH